MFILKNLIRVLNSKQSIEVYSKRPVNVCSWLVNRYINEWLATCFWSSNTPMSSFIVYSHYGLFNFQHSITCMFCCRLKTNTTGKILIWSLRSDFCPSNSVCVCIKKTLVNIYYIFVPIKLIIKNYFLVIETLWTCSARKISA